MKIPTYTKKGRRSGMYEKRIMKRTFKEGGLVLLFNSRLELFLDKLRS